MRILIRLVVLLLCPVFIQAQQQKRENLPADTSLVNRLNDTAYHYAYSNADTAILLSNKALAQAKRQKYMLGQTKAYLNLGRAYYTRGDYNKSLSFTLTANRLSKLVNYEAGMAIALNNIGLIYIAQDKFDMALAELKHALKINLAIGDLNNQTTNYFNMALCYVGLGDDKKASMALDETISLSKKTNNQRLLTMAINKMGDIAYRKKAYAQAIGHFTHVIGNKNYQNEWENAFAYTGIALSRYALKQYPEAIINAEQGLKHAQKVNAHWDIERALGILHQSYAAVANYKQAYAYFQLNKIYNDSLYSAKKEQEINALLLKQKQIENEELQHQILIKKQKDRVNKLVTLVIGCVALFLIILVYVSYRKNRQVRKLNKELRQSNADIAHQKEQILLQHQELAALNHSKDQLFAVIGHDMRSPIVSIIQTIDLLRSNHLSAAETSHVLDNFFEKLSATATMLDNLLLWANQQKHKVKTDKSSFNLAQLTDQLLLVLNFQAREKQVEIVHHTHNSASVFADVNHARIVLQNLISNAIKFTPSGGAIYIHYFTDRNKVGMVIRDTGVGIAKEKLEKLFTVMGKEISTYGTANEKGIGIGLMLVKKYADENDVEIIINSDQNGTEFVLVFNAAHQ